MTKTATPKKGMKIVTLEDGVNREVPASTVIGERCWFSSAPVGENCVVGANVSFRGRLGNNVHIGYDTEIGNIDIPDNVKIGNNVTLSGRIWLAPGTVIGDGVSIVNDVEIRPGVIVPANWSIPYSATVNPGPDGFPVVIVAPPRFNCNVRANDRGF